MALFVGPDLPDEMRKRLNVALGRVERADINDLLARDIDVLLDEFIDHFATVTVRWGEVTMSEPRPIGAGSVESTLRVPVDGDCHLLNYRSYSGAPAYTTVHGDARPGELVFTWQGPVETPPDAIRHWYEQRHSQIEQFVPNNNRDVQPLNQQMRERVQMEIERRRAAELSRRDLASSLPFPVLRQERATQPVAVKRRTIRTEPPKRPPTRRAFQPEPAMESEAYEQILTDLAAMATVYERTPLGKMGEEELRNILLGMLNTNFTGQVGGELFNGAGKTDILVRVEDRNVFIGECKFYKGPASVTKAVEQLLSYVVWRDTKAALLLFVRSGNFTDIVAKAVEAVSSHPRCERSVEPTEPTRRSDYVFTREEDPDRAIHLALLPFKLT